MPAEPDTGRERAETGERKRERERDTLMGKEKHARQEENTKEDACRVGKREGQKKEKANKRGR